ncbi:hypothetical protein [Fuerstiella marisgermanici]|uniref:Uncharacterized protein n=1 Tax=Fuerstiella marisgermanici TaxID=1891926 RepID=A0A1P8W9G2_9PLAN|nr:hypothetical protein [Fuerstiella marisgermanici]APZ90696.1 hypothetical protein Fuma_00277 [Fuerstiella marisgermanici]
MKTSTLLSNLFRKSLRKSRRRRQSQNRMVSLERLEARELLTAAMAWDGDALQITGSDERDFIAVQQDSMGLRVFTEDAILTEHAGRAFDTATSITVFGQGGDDILLSHQTEIPVNLHGDGGNDFLYSDTTNDSLNGGDGLNWIQFPSSQATDADVLDVFGLELLPDSVSVTPEFDKDGRMELQVDMLGQVDIAGQNVDLAGRANLSSDGVDVELTGAVAQWSDAFGIDPLDMTSSSLTVSAGTHVNDGNGYHIDLNSNLQVSGTDISVDGSLDITDALATAAFTGTVANWDDAFGIPGLDLSNGVLTASGSIDADNNQNFSLGVSADMQVEDTLIEVAGSVEFTPQRTNGVFRGSVDNWDDAFGITGLDLTDSELNIVAYTDHQGDYGLSVDLLADMHVEGTAIAIAGNVNVTPDQIDAVFHGSVADWDDAFGIEGLDLTDSELNVAASSNRVDDYRLSIDLLADMVVDDVEIDVAGSVEITPEQIDAVFNGSVDDWDDAFGIEALDLTDTELQVVAFSDRRDDFDLRFDLFGDMDIQGTNAKVSGSVDVEPNRIDGTLTGNVAGDWENAFGIAGLTFSDTRLTISAVIDESTGSSLGMNLEADMDLSGTEIAVTGQVDVDNSGVSGSFFGVVTGSWTSAFGIAPLHLQDTTLSIAGSRTAAGSELSLGVSAGMYLMGTHLGLTGTVDMTPGGVRTNLTTSVEGEWVDAFAIPGLELRDTALSIGAGVGFTGLEIDLDTDLKLFGDYIEMIGDLDISTSGVELSFSPPASIGFTDLLGIPGFTLDDADLTVTGGANGLEVAVDTTLDLGTIDVDFTGAFSVYGPEVRASMTGRIAEWNNAFDVPGMNLDDIVLTLGAESGVGGASMYVGLGAGMAIGSSNLAVAGLLGFGTTGWEVAFRGSIDSLESDDLIDFANSMNRAADPNATEIPDGALGDLELRTAYVNFAPYGGNAELGITDGFGIGGAFYDDGKLLGSGEFIVDLASGVFEVGLEIPELDLGPVELNDVLIDIRIATTDSHYHVAGTAALMGAEVSLEGKVSSNSFSLQGTAAVDMEGLSASVQFIVDQNGIRFVATAGGGAINAVKDNMTANLRAAANVAQAAIDHAQAGVDLARNGVKSLEADLAEARAEAQKAADKVKANINKAKVVVDNARSSKNNWYSQKQSRYKAWRKAVAVTKSAAWYKKAYYKGIEAAKYSSYAYAVGRYSAQVAVYNTANAAYHAVRNAAGWVLDNAGVEANPEVLRIKALLVVANAGLGASEFVLDGIEQANSGLLQALDAVDSVRVTRITIEGNVSNYANAGVRVTIEMSVGGRTRLLTLNASTEDLVQQLGRQLISAVV